MSTNSTPSAPAELDESEPPAPSRPRLRSFLGGCLALFVVVAAPAASAVDDRSDESEVAGATASSEAEEDPEIVFPVVGPVTFTDTWGACRGAGCSRSHKGVDIFGHKLAPLVAAEAGTITFIRQSAMSISGNTIIIESDRGWRYLYIHLNNDGPGTDDGSNPQAWIVPNRLRVGDRVEAGQVIGYLGDSGNAETTPAHVHFEVHRPGVGAINPTPFAQDAWDAGRRVTVASLASSAEGRAEWEPTIVDWYQSLLGRSPTDMELFAWADRFDIGFATVDDLIADLTMAKSRRDPAGDVVRAFRVALDRLPTDREIDAWEGALVSGDFSFDQLNQILIESDAFAVTYGELSDEDFVRRLYDNATGRPPSDQRLADWLEELAAGQPRWTVGAQLADSYSVKNSTWHGLEVVQSFRAALDRMPGSDEYQRWVDHLDAGGLIPDVVDGIRADPDEVATDDEAPPADPAEAAEATDDQSGESEDEGEGDQDGEAPASEEDQGGEDGAESPAESEGDPAPDQSDEPEQDDQDGGAPVDGDATDPSEEGEPADQDSSVAGTTASTGG